MKKKLFGVMSFVSAQVPSPVWGTRADMKLQIPKIPFTGKHEEFCVSPRAESLARYEAWQETLNAYGHFWKAIVAFIQP